MQNMQNMLYMQYIAQYGQYALSAEYVNLPFHMRTPTSICHWYAEKYAKKYEHPVFHMHLYAEYEPPPKNMQKI